jgi:hypothetical protein
VVVRIAIVRVQGMVVRVRGTHGTIFGRHAGRRRPTAKIAFA